MFARIAWPNTWKWRQSLEKLNCDRQFLEAHSLSVIDQNSDLFWFCLRAWPELDLCSSSSFWRYANPWRWIIENKSCRQPLVRLTVELNRDRKIQLTSQSTSTSSFYISFINSRLVILRFSSNNSLPVVLFFDEYANPSRSFMYFTVWKSTPLLSKRFFFSVFVYISQNRIKITRKRPANWTLAYANDLCWQPLVR